MMRENKVTSKVSLTFCNPNVVLSEKTLYHKTASYILTSLMSFAYYMLLQFFTLDSHFEIPCLHIFP